MRFDDDGQVKKEESKSGHMLLLIQTENTRFGDIRYVIEQNGVSSLQMLRTKQREPRFEKSQLYGSVARAWARQKDEFLT